MYVHRVTRVTYRVYPLAIPSFTDTKVVCHFFEGGNLHTYTFKTHIQKPLPSTTHSNLLNKTKHSQSLATHTLIRSVSVWWVGPFGLILTQRETPWQLYFVLLYSVRTMIIQWRKGNYWMTRFKLKFIVFLTISLYVRYIICILWCNSWLYVYCIQKSVAPTSYVKLEIKTTHKHIDFRIFSKFPRFKLNIYLTFLITWIVILT